MEETEEKLFCTSTRKELMKKRWLIAFVASGVAKWILQKNDEYTGGLRTVCMKENLKDQLATEDKQWGSDEESRRGTNNNRDNEKEEMGLLKTQRLYTDGCNWGGKEEDGKAAMFQLRQVVQAPPKIPISM